jgi:hypothetical protein
MDKSIARLRERGEKQKLGNQKAEIGRRKAVLKS